jgi:hypothetical protein
MLTSVSRSNRKKKTSELDIHWLLSRFYNKQVSLYLPGPLRLSRSVVTGRATTFSEDVATTTSYDINGRN